MEYITITLLALSLSLDAFTLAVAYGLLNLKKDKIIITSLLVGLFHFFMPLIGIEIGHFLLARIPFNTNLLMVIILILIGIEMIKSLNEEELKEQDLNLSKSLLFAFLVSLDSLLVGFGLSIITDKILLSGIVFALFSTIFTLSGFFLGKYITKKSKKNAKIIGIVIIFTLIIYFLCK